MLVVDIKKCAAIDLETTDPYIKESVASYRHKDYRMLDVGVAYYEGDKLCTETFNSDVYPSEESCYEAVNTFLKDKGITTLIAANGLYDFPRMIYRGFPLDNYSVLDVQHLSYLLNSEADSQTLAALSERYDLGEDGKLTNPLLEIYKSKMAELKSKYRDMYYDYLKRDVIATLRLTEILVTKVNERLEWLKYSTKAGQKVPRTLPYYTYKASNYEEIIHSDINLYREFIYLAMQPIPFNYEKMRSRLDVFKAEIEKALDNPLFSPKPIFVKGEKLTYIQVINRLNEFRDSFIEFSEQHNLFLELKEEVIKATTLLIEKISSDRTALEANPQLNKNGKPKKISAYFSLKPYEKEFNLLMFKKKAIGTDALRRLCVTYWGNSLPTDLLKNDSISLDKENMKKIRALKHELTPEGLFIFSTLDKVSRITKLKQFIDTWLEHKELFGDVFTGIYINRTRTARMSSKGINFQQIPSELKDLIEAPEGWSIVNIDYASEESKVHLLIGQDKEGMDKLTKDPNFDSHSSTAIKMGVGTLDWSAYKDKISSEFKGNFRGALSFRRKHKLVIENGVKYLVDKKARGIIKNLVFSQLYGGTYRTVARTAGVDIKVAKAYEERLHQVYPTIKAAEDTLSQMARSGYILNLFGRAYPTFNYSGLLRDVVVEDLKNWIDYELSISEDANLASIDTENFLDAISEEEEENNNQDRNFMFKMKQEIFKNTYTNSSTRLKQILNEDHLVEDEYSRNMPFSEEENKIITGMYTRIKKDYNIDASRDKFCTLITKLKKDDVDYEQLNDLGKIFYNAIQFKVISLGNTYDLKKCFLYFIYWTLAIEKSALKASRLVFMSTLGTDIDWDNDNLKVQYETQGFHMLPSNGEGKESWGRSMKLGLRPLEALSSTVQYRFSGDNSYKYRNFEDGFLRWSVNWHFASKLIGSMEKVFNKLVNTVIQGSCADVLRYVLHKMYIQGLYSSDAKLIAPIHDSLLAMVKNEFISTYVEQAKNIMQIDIGGVLLTVDSSVGQNWRG